MKVPRGSGFVLFTMLSMTLAEGMKKAPFVSSQTIKEAIEIKAAGFPRAPPLRQGSGRGAERTGCGTRSALPQGAYIPHSILLKEVFAT